MCTIDFFVNCSNKTYNKMVIPLTIAITIYFIVALFFGYILVEYKEDLNIPHDLEKVVPYMVLLWPLTLILYGLIKNKII